MSVSHGWLSPTGAGVGKVQTKSSKVSSGPTREDFRVEVPSKDLHLFHCGFKKLAFQAPNSSHGPAIRGLWFRAGAIGGLPPGPKRLGWDSGLNADGVREARGIIIIFLQHHGDKGRSGETIGSQHTDHRAEVNFLGIPIRCPCGSHVFPTRAVSGEKPQCGGPTGSFELRSPTPARISSRRGLGSCPGRSVRAGLARAHLLPLLSPHAARRE